MLPPGCLGPAWVSPLRGMHSMWPSGFDGNVGGPVLCKHQSPVTAHVRGSLCAGRTQRVQRLLGGAGQHSAPHLRRARAARCVSRTGPPRQLGASGRNSRDASATNAGRGHHAPLGAVVLGLVWEPRRSAPARMPAAVVGSVYAANRAN